MDLRKKVMENLEKDRLIGIVRLKSSDALIDVAKALQSSGVNFLEITLTMPGALEGIKKVSNEMKGEFYVGAGTVLDKTMAEKSIAAGASFLVGPNFDYDVVRIGHKHNVAVMSGALTPTEVINAWRSGADIVKIFPSSLAGPGYFSDLKGPFPEVRLMPTGSVNYETVPEYLAAGAFALGVGTSMIVPEDVYKGDFDSVAERAKKMHELISNVAR